MDNKQKKKLLGSVYGALTLVAVLALGWVVYLAVDKILNKTGKLWIDAVIIAISALLLILFNI